jgi:hypothetical protein
MANGSQTVTAVITADAKPFKKAVGDAGKSFDGFGKAAAAGAAIAAAAFVVATKAATDFLLDSAKAAAEAEAIGRGLQNAAENAGVFASQAGGIDGATQALKDYTDQLGEAIGKDDEKLQEIVTGWLAVPQLASLGVDGLQNLLKVAADVAAGTGKDLDSVANSFIKVAGDGETALSKLLRQGIVFTDEQKNQYQALLDSNDEIGAQAYLIETLGTKYEGAAAAIANPFDRVKVIFENFQEELGTKLLPVFDELIPQLEAFLDGLLADPEFMQFIEDLAQGFVEMLPLLQDLLPPFMDLAKVLFPALAEFIPVIVNQIENMSEIMGGAGGDGKELAEVVSFIAGGLMLLSDALVVVIGWFKEQFDLMAKGEPNFLMLLSPIATLVTGINSISDALQGVIGWWNELWGIQQDQPLQGVSSDAAMLDRRLNTSAGATSRSSNVNISVNAIAPTAEVGRAVVDSLRSYQRVGGRI